MENNHLTYFKVENFKKFDALEVKNIGQFNLIVGDNNVGKTCLLESLILEFHAKKTLSALHYIAERRNIKLENDIDYNINKEDFNFNYNLVGLVQKDKNKSVCLYRGINNNPPVKFEIENIKGESPSSREDLNEFIKKTDLFQYKAINQMSKNWLAFKKNNQSKSDSTQIEFLCDVTSSYYKDFYYYLDYLPLIKINDFYSNDILSFYKEIIKSPKDELRLIELVKKIFKNIEINRFSIFDYFNKLEYLQISTTEKIDYHPINEYGDGFIRILSIIFELLYNNENKQILIDEFEIGIHYSKQKDFWINIMTVCKELGIQLFATTHSKECISAYLDASKIMQNESEIRLIELKEFNSVIYSNTHSYESIITSFESNIELRGGNIFKND